MRVCKWVYSCVSSGFTAVWVSGGAAKCEWRAPKWRAGHMDPAGGHPGPGRLLLFSLHTSPSHLPTLVSSCHGCPRDCIVDILWGTVAASCLDSYRRWSIQQHTRPQLKPVSCFWRSFNLCSVIYRQFRPNLHRNKCCPVPMATLTLAIGNIYNYC